MQLSLRFRFGQNLFSIRLIYLPPLFHLSFRKIDSFPKKWLLLCCFCYRRRRCSTSSSSRLYAKRNVFRSNINATMLPTGSLEMQKGPRSVSRVVCHRANCRRIEKFARVAPSFINMRNINIAYNTCGILFSFFALQVNIPCNRDNNTFHWDRIDSALKREHKDKGESCSRHLGIIIENNFRAKASCSNSELSGDNNFPQWMEKRLLLRSSLQHS